MSSEKMRCIECGEPAMWLRSTQFAGDHPFCDLHARQEKNFGEPDCSYFSWIELDKEVAPETEDSIVDS